MKRPKERCPWCGVKRALVAIVSDRGHHWLVCRPCMVKARRSIEHAKARAGELLT